MNPTTSQLRSLRDEVPPSMVETRQRIDALIERRTAASSRSALNLRSELGILCIIFAICCVTSAAGYGAWAWLGNFTNDLGRPLVIVMGVAFTITFGAFSIRAADASRDGSNHH